MSNSTQLSLSSPVGNSSTVFDLEVMQFPAQFESYSSFDEIVLQGAQQLLQTAIEPEFAELRQRRKSQHCSGGNIHSSKTPDLSLLITTGLRVSFTGPGSQIAAPGPGTPARGAHLVTATDALRLPPLCKRPARDSPLRRSRHARQTGIRR